MLVWTSTSLQYRFNPQPSHPSNSLTGNATLKYGPFRPHNLHSNPVLNPNPNNKNQKFLHPSLRHPSLNHLQVFLPFYTLTQSKPLTTDSQ